MKNLLKAAVALILTGLSFLSLIVSVIYTLGTVLTWSTTNTSNKFGIIVFWGLTVLLMGLSGTVLEHVPYQWAKPKLKTVTGLDFEHHCAKLLMKRGFREVIVTPPSGDYGADLIAYDRKGNKWVFQCKHYKGKVSNGAVQEVVAAKAHYQANRAAVMTNSKLTAQARQLALENEIELFEMLSD